MFSTQSEVFDRWYPKKTKLHLFWKIQPGFKFYQIREAPWLHLKTVGRTSLCLDNFFSRAQHSQQLLLLFPIFDTSKMPEVLLKNSTMFADFFYIYELKIFQRGQKQNLITTEIINRKIAQIVLALITWWVKKAKYWYFR